MAPVFAFLAITAGCAGGINDKNTPNEHVKITRLSVQETHGEFSSALGSHLPGNAATGLLGGVMRGFLYGMLNPAAWLMGGPLTTTALEGARSAACGSALGNVDNPSAKLQELVTRAGPWQQFRNELESALREEDTLAVSQPDGTFYPEPPDTILEIREISIILDGYMRDDEFVAECQPYLVGRITWRVTRKSNSRQIREGTTVCSTTPSIITFTDWFDDISGIHDEIAWLLKSLGKQVTNDVLGEDKDKYLCR